MACGVAVKRSLDSTFIGHGGLDAAEEPVVKHLRTTTHCSPFRASFGTMANSLPSSSFSTQTTTAGGNGAAAASSPFSSIESNLNRGQLESYLIAEVKHLRRRRLIPKRRAVGDHQLEYRPPASPPHSSDSEGENQQVSPAAEARATADDRRKASRVELFDKPQFSLNQVQMICERLLKEQEVRLRYEYETALNTKLQEQYETFCKFTEDQIKQKMDEKRDNSLSYVS